MARNELVSCSAGEWTELSGGEDVSGIITIQNTGTSDVRVLATATGAAPNVTNRAGFVFGPGEADARTLSDMFPGAAVPARLWAFAPKGGAVMVSYA